jgi:tryptophanyl-tRNA synthetase
MSKSDPDPRSRIELTDEPEVIVAKCKKAVTDFKSEVTYDPEERRGVATLIELMSICTGRSHEQVCEDNRDVDTGKFKLRVGDALVEYLTPIRKQFKQLIAEPQYLNEVLNKGALRANTIADTTWKEVKQKVGIGLL